MTGFDAIPDGLRPRPARLLLPADVPVEIEGEAGKRSHDSFAATLHSALREVATLQRDAHDKAMALARGEPVEIHDVLVAMGKSEVAFNLALEVRNRLQQAWDTLSRLTT